MPSVFRGRWFYINLATIGCALLLGFWWWQHTEQQTLAAKPSWIPDYYLTNATVSQYNQEGILSSKISAERFTHIQEFGTTDMIKPRFNFYIAGSDTDWFGKANEGLLLDSGAQINLTGDALVTNGPDIDRPLSLKSQSLRFFPQQNYAESDQQVSLVAKYSQLTGTGMRLNLDNQRLQLLQQVKGTHSIPRN